MGRILRKKTSGNKKKKKQSVDRAASSRVNSDVVAKKTALRIGSVKDTKKWRVPSLKKSSSATMPALGEQKKNYLDKALQFLREVKVELKKVTWPTRKQTIGSTVVVIILVMIISLFLGVVDIGLSSLMRVVLQ